MSAATAVPSRLVTSLVGVDLRALAALRVGLASILLWDQAIALRSVRWFYSDAGMLPRGAFFTERVDKASQWCLHLMGGSVGFQSAMLIVAMLAAVAMLVGWRTRVATLVSWVLLCSLHARHPGVLFGGDVVLRMLVFWSLFLPLGARVSFDAAGKPRATPAVWSNLASMALLLQVALIYWITAILKHGAEWTRDGTALYYVLSADQFVHGFGRWLLGWPDVCHWLSHAVWWLELLGPFAVFIPLGTRWWRLLVVPCMWALHVGIALCMALGMFPWIMVVAWLPFIPPMAWDWLSRHCRPRLARRQGDALVAQGTAQPADLAAREPQRVLLPKWALWLRARSASPLAAWQVAWQTQGCVALCLVVVFGLCLSSIEPPRFAWAAPAWLRPLVATLRLDQYWGLFAPTPIKNDGWLVLEAELYDHSHVDLLRGGQPLSFAKPEYVSAEYPDWKWQKLEANLAEPTGKPYRMGFGNALSQRWSEAQTDPKKKVRSWVLHHMLEVTLLHYAAMEPQRYELARNEVFVVED